MWDRFGWGPEQTDKFTLAGMKMLFAILEQQRVSRDAVENPRRGESVIDPITSGKMLDNIMGKNQAQEQNPPPANT